MIDAGTYDISHLQGTTFDRTFTVTVNGTALNLTGYTAALQVRETFADTVLVSLTSGSGITLGGTAGTIQVVTAATTTSAVAPGDYQYDLWLYQGSTQYPILTGKYKIAGTITK